MSLATAVRRLKARTTQATRRGRRLGSWAQRHREEDPIEAAKRSRHRHRYRDDMHL